MLKVQLKNTLSREFGVIALSWHLTIFFCFTDTLIQVKNTISTGRVVFISGIEVLLHDFISMVCSRFTNIQVLFVKINFLLIGSTKHNSLSENMKYNFLKHDTNLQKLPHTLGSFYKPVQPE